jgi:hypothetical protein
LELLTLVHAAEPCFSRCSPLVVCRFVAGDDRSGSGGGIGFGGDGLWSGGGGEDGAQGRRHRR